MNRTIAEQEELEAFGKHLKDSVYILALVGAGLSAPSGIPTFSGADRTWRGIDCRMLATAEYFSDNPQVVWEYYRQFRQKVIDSAPNAGHIALAQLSKAKHGFLTVTQNIDGIMNCTKCHSSAYISLDLSERAGHLSSRLNHLHGSLSTVRCSDEGCHYSNSYELIAQIMGPPPNHLSSEDTPFTEADLISLPNPPICPACSESFLRPGVVWFGELLPTHDQVDDWIKLMPRIDAMLVIGTEVNLSAPAGFINSAKDSGATVAHFNIKKLAEGLQEDEDYWFSGDVSVTLPEVINKALEL
jgi:NAD-dependent deacetylase sirtuin 5